MPIEATSEPWPVSVIAKAPGISVLTALPKKVLWWYSVPRYKIAELNNPYWTPYLICNEGSANSSSSKLESEAPGFMVPPNSDWKPCCVAPAATRVRSCFKTVSRCSVIGWPSCLKSLCSSITERVWRRTSAHLPKTLSPIASTSS